MLNLPKIKIKKSSVAKKNFPLLLTCSSKKEALQCLKLNNIDLYKWQEKLIEENDLSIFEVTNGFLGVLIYSPNKKSQVPGEFLENSYSFGRDKILNWLKKINFSDFSIIESEPLDLDLLFGLGVGIGMSAYNYKKNKDFTVFTSAKEIHEGIIKAESINSARHLVDLPPNLLGPTEFKKIITKHFDKKPGFSVEVIDRKKLVKEGYGLISGVGQGRDDGPYLIIVKYKNSKSKKNIGAVGKGITFDTGGLDVKPSQYMRWMKKDMGGAAALFGFADWCLKNKPKINIDFVFCLAENSVSEKAFRPGDILKAKNGKTVEIHNTDAEGRLAMASGYGYLDQSKTKYDVCFDVSTLTGAIKVGLDDRIGGLFSNDLSLGQNLQEASEKSGDPLWLMPLPRWTSLSSSVADYVNAKDGYGGAISAAEFLRYFAPKNTPWFHLDIYAWTDSSRDSFQSKGGSGQGVQVLIEWINNLN